MRRVPRAGRGQYPRRAVADMTDMSAVSYVSDVEPGEKEDREMPDYDRHLIATGKVAANFALLEFVTGTS